MVGLMRKSGGAPDYSKRATIYELEYTDCRNYDFLLGLVSSSHGPIIDVPCGCGRHAEMMASTGREVIAIDIEPSMIAEVAGRVARSGMENIVPIVGDMRRLNPPKAAELLVVAPEAFQFLTDLDEASAALSSMARSLTPNGRVVLDLSPYRRVPNPKLEYYDPLIPDGTEIEEWTKRSRLGELITRWRSQHHPNPHTVEVHFRYRCVSEAGDKEWLASMTFRIFGRDEIRWRVRRAGLEVLDEWGDYDRTPILPTSPRMIFLLGRDSSRRSRTP